MINETKDKFRELGELLSDIRVRLAQAGLTRTGRMVADAVSMLYWESAKLGGDKYSSPDPSHDVLKRWLLEHEDEVSLI